MQKACLSQRTGWLHYKSQELITSTAVMISPRHKLKPVWFGLMESSHPLSLSLFPAGCVSNLSGGNVWDGSVPILWPQTRVLSEHDLWCSHKLTVWGPVVAPNVFKSPLAVCWVHKLSEVRKSDWMLNVDGGGFQQPEGRSDPLDVVNA